VTAADYLRDHAAHAAVVLVFLLYPPVNGALLASPLSDEASAFLPGITFVIVVLYMGLFAMSFDFVSGYTGYLSFGHAAFYGTGAYFVVLAANGQIPGIPGGTPFMVTLLLGALLAALLALVIGSVSFRLTGVYFAMITLGFAQVIYELIRSWGYVSTNPQEGATIGGDGLAIGVPYVDALNLRVGRLTGDSVQNLLGLGIDVSATVVSYYALGAVVLVSYFAMQRILHSPFGRVMSRSARTRSAPAPSAIRPTGSSWPRSRSAASSGRSPAGSSPRTPGRCRRTTPTSSSSPPTR